MRKAAWKLFALALVFAALIFTFGTAAAGEKFTVGWQPYYISTFQVAIIQELGLMKKYLPGVEVVFQEALHGAIHTNNMLAGKLEVGYMAVMASNIACSKRDQADIRQVANDGVSNGTACALLLARADAPDFRTPEEAVKWLDGKVVASPRGSCADQFMRMAFEKFGVTPAQYLNQSLEIIQANFRAGKLDASAIWEPTASRIGNLAGEGVAKVVATGNLIGSQDIGQMIMRGDFIENHPALAEGYLKAELEALLYMIDPQNREKAVDMIAKYAVGIPKRAIWYSLYGEIPAGVGGSEPRQTYSFIIDDNIRKNINDVWAFQFRQKIVAIEKPYENTIDDRLARKVLADAGLKSPIGEIKGQPAADNPYKK
jgi:NitT/TauT family transport system substrate-binding protein